MATPRTTPGWLRPLVFIALAAATALVLAGALFIAGSAPLPGRPQADGGTVLLASISEWIARVASIMTLGGLAAASFFCPTDTGGRIGSEALRLTRVAGRAGQLWLWASVLAACANPAYVNGVPLAYVLTPGSWSDFASASPSAIAWACSAAVALACTLAAYFSRRVGAMVLGLTCGVAAWTFVAATGSVTVGADHDWATDAAIWATAAQTLLLACLAGVVLAGGSGPAAGPTSLRRRLTRLARVGVPLALVAMAGHLVIAWQQLAGTAPLASAYGAASLALLVVLGLIALLAGATVRGGHPGVLGAWGVLGIALLALLTLENQLPSPRFFVPQTAQINYLGYDAPRPVTIGALLLPGRPNWLWIVLVTLALASYLIGVVRLHRADGHWPVARTIPWVAGCLLMGYLAVSGFWEYSTVVYSWHMFVHMTVNMLVPALCVLGAPLTLLREASASRPAGQLAGPSEAIHELGRLPLVQRVFSTPVLWANYVGSLFVIYYTPLFPWLMRFHWAHQLMLLYFMVTGYLFFSMIVGIDKQLHELPHLVRLALVISIMPFHAIFAVGIMGATGLIGETFYKTIAVPWNADLMADQSKAGQITWLLGEIPLFIVMIALAAQWFSHDKVENARLDRAVAAGEDDSLDAYNAMLAELAERDRSAARKDLL